MDVGKVVGDWGNGLGAKTEDPTSVITDRDLICATPGKQTMSRLSLCSRES